MKIPVDIVYFAPKYTQEGDCTEVFFLSGEKKIYKCSVKTFIKNLYSMYAIDVVALRKIMQSKIGQKNLLPIVLPDATFVPYKVRVPLLKCDPSSGYVNLSQVFKINSDEEGFKILLKCGCEIKSIGTERYFRKRLLIGSILTDYFQGIWQKGICTVKEESELENFFKLM